MRVKNPISSFASFITGTSVVRTSNFAKFEFRKTCKFTSQPLKSFIKQWLSIFLLPLFHPSFFPSSSFCTYFLFPHTQIDPRHPWKISRQEEWSFFLSSFFNPLVFYALHNMPLFSIFYLIPLLLYS